MSYSDEHQRLLANIQAGDGIEVEFVKTIPGSYNPATDTMSAPVVSSVKGFALEAPADPEKYGGLGLELQKHALLIFAPLTYGEEPEIGSMVAWAGADRRAVHQMPVRPNGQTIGTKVFVE